MTTKGVELYTNAFTLSSQPVAVAFVAAARQAVSGAPSCPKAKGRGIMNNKHELLSCFLAATFGCQPALGQGMATPSLQGYAPVMYSHGKTVSGCGMRFFHGGGEQRTWLDGSVNLLLREDGLIYGVFTLAVRNVDRGARPGPGARSPSIHVDHAWMQFDSGTMLEPLETHDTAETGAYAAVLAFENGVDVLTALANTRFTLGFHTGRDSNERVVTFDKSSDPDTGRRMQECLHQLIDAANRRLGD